MRRTITYLAVRCMLERTPLPAGPFIFSPWTFHPLPFGVTTFSVSRALFVEQYRHRVMEREFVGYLNEQPPRAISKYLPAAKLLSMSPTGPAHRALQRLREPVRPGQ